jgi:hypothetical protein
LRNEPNPNCSSCGARIVEVPPGTRVAPVQPSGMRWVSTCLLAINDSPKKVPSGALVASITSGSGVPTPPPSPASCTPKIVGLRHAFIAMQVVVAATFELLIENWVGPVEPVPTEMPVCNLRSTPCPATTARWRRRC